MSLNPTYQDRIQNGDLTGCLEELARQVKNKPNDFKLRAALVEALCFSGDLDRAAKHLATLLSMTPERPDLVIMHQNLVKAEQWRRDVFSQGKTPHLLPEPSVELQLRLEAIHALAKQERDVFDDKYRAAQSHEPSVRVEYEEAENLSLRDYDDLLGPVLEVHFHDGRYVWLEQKDLNRIIPDPVLDWTNTLWRPVVLILNSGDVFKAFIPALYVDSYLAESDSVKLGLATEWIDLGNHVYRGLGQRLLLIGEREVPLLELKPISFSPANRSETDTPAETP